MITTIDGMQIIRVWKKEPDSWVLMPELLDRIRTRCNESGGNGEALATRMEAEFIVCQESIAAWVVVKNGRIVGHTLLTCDSFNLVPELFVAQLVAPGVPRAVVQAADDEISDWARGKGYHRLVMITRRLNLRAWRKLFGFQMFRAILYRELG